MRAMRMSGLRILVFVALGTLAGCGADGEPIPPSMSAGIGVSSNGYVGGGVGIHQGPISLFIGF